MAEEEIPSEVEDVPSLKFLSLAAVSFRNVDLQYNLYVLSHSISGII